MTLLWPEELPKFVSTDGYGEAPVSQVLRTSMATGPQKQRRRVSKKIVNLSATVLMTTEQVEIFESFFDNDIGGGSLEFLFMSPRTQTEGTYRFLEAGYKIDYVAEGYWNVNLSLEKME